MNNIVKKMNNTVKKNTKKKTVKKNTKKKTVKKNTKKKIIKKKLTPGRPRLKGRTITKELIKKRKTATDFYYNTHRAKIKKAPHENKMLLKRQKNEFLKVLNKYMTENCYKIPSIINNIKIIYKLDYTGTI